MYGEVMKKYTDIQTIQSGDMIKKSAIRGFTMIEMMITLVIAGIVLAIAVPSMQSMTANSLAEKATGLIELDLKLARSNAITRGETVRITPVSGNLANGWTVTAVTSGDLIRERGAFPDQVTITTTGFGSGFAGFTATGQIEEIGTIIVKTSGCTGNENKTISLITSGQIAVTENACP